MDSGDDPVEEQGQNRQPVVHVALEGDPELGLHPAAHAALTEQDQVGPAAA